jgi:hypothetical protein
VNDDYAEGTQDERAADLSWVALDTRLRFEEVVPPTGSQEDPWAWYREDVLASSDNRIVSETIDSTGNCIFALDLTVEGAFLLGTLDTSDIVEGLMRDHPGVDRSALTRRVLDLSHQHHAIFGLTTMVQVRVLAVRTGVVPLWFEFSTTMALSDWHGGPGRRSQLLLAATAPHLEARRWDTRDVTLYPRATIH